MADSAISTSDSATLVPSTFRFTPDATSSVMVPSTFSFSPDATLSAASVALSTFSFVPEPSSSSSPFDSSEATDAQTASIAPSTTIDLPSSVSVAGLSSASLTSTTLVNPSASVPTSSPALTPSVTIYTILPVTATLSSTTTSSPPTCIPATHNDSTWDDVPAISAAFAACGAGGTIVFPANRTWNILSQLTITNCFGCDWQIEGTLALSTNLTYWNGVKSAITVSKCGPGQIRSLTKKGIHFQGNGTPYWLAYNANSSYSRPVFFTMYTTTGFVVSNLNFADAPTAFISVNGNANNVTFNGINITASSPNATIAALIKNTDGFDIGPAVNVNVYNTYIQNQDDCVVWKAGANYSVVQNLTCVGSHGVSVGSLGQTVGRNDTVTNVLAHNLSMINNNKASGIKIYPGGPTHGTAYVANVTWDTVNVTGSYYAVQILSCYLNTPLATCQTEPSSAIMTDIFFKNFFGTLGTAASNAKTVLNNINGGYNGTTNLHFSNWTVKPYSGTATNLCNNITNLATSGLAPVPCTGVGTG
ncbi:hypothetical protein HKX48_006736 [Thoreauomyces humboldtii]|nr:hypothetical protein HKX48_006736 [Thoreauomyces humboldtii]